MYIALIQWGRNLAAQFGRQRRRSLQPLMPDRCLWCLWLSVSFVPGGDSIAALHSLTETSLRWPHAAARQDLEPTTLNGWSKKVWCNRKETAGASLKQVADDLHTVGMGYCETSTSMKSPRFSSIRSCQVPIRQAMVASVCSSLTSIVTHFRHSEKRRRYECTNFVIWTYEFQRWTQPVKAAASIVASFKKLPVWNAWNRAMIW